MTTTTPPTCGAQYRALVDVLFPSFSTQNGGFHSLLFACPGSMYFGCFALGSMQGEAAKVAMGACQAFMIRPAPDWWQWSIEAMGLICDHYGLRIHMDDTQRELWGVQSRAQNDLALTLAQVVNSPQWHVGRARLCGIPVAQIDRAYHERDTYGVRCEPEGREP